MDLRLTVVTEGDVITGTVFVDGDLDGRRFTGWMGMVQAISSVIEGAEDAD